MAVFCDFENIALGVNEVGFSKFQIDKVLERLLVKGNIVVKKAYCDWSRYESFKRSMHEAAFELIDIPHVRQSGKNSADIRMVVDALDLCYTKAHVDAFVVVSGDSDFSPLVSKLRENNKVVIGVGVKHSTSDLLVANCDEFIFYDELVEKKPRRAAKKAGKPTTKKSARTKSAENIDDDGIELVVSTIDSLIDEIGGRSSLWGSMVKQAIKRQRPGFNERAHGFKSFNAMLEVARDRGLIALSPDEKSGGYVIETAGD
jgi:uncharacterized protein (TIGR00288 family)